MKKIGKLLKRKNVLPKFFSCQEPKSYTQDLLKALDYSKERILNSIKCLDFYQTTALSTKFLQLELFDSEITLKLLSKTKDFSEEFYNGREAKKLNLYQGNQIIRSSVFLLRSKDFDKLKQSF